MNSFLPIAQIITGIVLIVFVLLQQRGASLGAAFGESGGFYATRRGMEKKFFWGTIIFGAIFVILALLNLII